MKLNLLSILLFTGIFSFAQYTYVPDDNFEQALIDLGHDNVLDNYVNTTSIRDMTYLTIPSRNITDLTGIEDFYSLENLNCWDNLLHDLNLSKNPNLKRINCFNNRLENINITNCSKLEFIDCSSNQLTNLDVSQNSLLRTIGVSENQLLYIDVRQNPLLRSLACYNNQLTDLNLSYNENLVLLYCYGNQLTQLNLKNGNNINIVEIDGWGGLNAKNNPNLLCIQVDDAAWSEANWTNVDEWSSFNQDCQYMSTNGTRIHHIQNLSKPNQKLPELL